MRRHLPLYTFFLSLICAGIFFTPSLNTAHAATKTWGGGGSTNNWTECANWVGGVCPNSGDDIVFNTTSTKDSTIDASATSTVASISINTGYTGTLVQQRDMTITGSFSQAAGTFLEQTYSLSISSGYSMTGGTIYAGVSTTTLSGASSSFTQSAGTFNASSTKAVHFNTSASGQSTSFSCVGTFPGVVSIGITGSDNFTLGSGCTASTSPTTSTAANVIVSGTLNFGSAVSVGYFSVNSGGAVTMSATTMNITASNASFTINSGGTFNATGITVAFTTSASGQSTSFNCTGTFSGTVSIAISGSDSFTVGSGCTINTSATTNTAASVVVNGTINFGSAVSVGYLTVNSGGTVTMSGTTMNITAANASFTINSGGTFNATGITVAFTTSASGQSTSFSCTGTFSGTVNIAISGTDSFTIGSGCGIALSGNTSTVANVVNNGTLDFNGYSFSATSLTLGTTATLRLQGTENTTMPTNLPASSTIEYYGSGTYSSLKFSTTTYQNLSITGAGTWATSTNLSINGGFNQTAGTFNHTGTLTFTGTTASTFATTSSGTNFKHVTLNKSGQTLTLAGSGLALTGNLTITAGTLDASTNKCSSSSCNISLTGNWSNSGTFTARTGTVSLTGGSQSLAGSTTFYNFTKATSTADTLTLPASQTQIIQNTLTLTGAASNLLSLRSSITNTQWSINPQGTRALAYLDVKDSNNTNASAISAIGLTNSGNNTNWSFASPAPVITPVTIASNNASTTLAKSGNTATVSFTSDQAVLVTPSGTIGAHTASFTNTSGTNWTAVATLSSSDTEGAITFSLTVGNVDGTGTTTVTAITSGSNVVFDKTAPTITLRGQNPDFVTPGASYSDPGATATDSHDGTVTVTTAGTVGTTVGTYTRTYSATDAVGNSTQTTRTVYVELGAFSAAPAPASLPVIVANPVTLPPIVTVPTPSTPPAIITPTFARPLKTGSVGLDVQKLQIFLNTHGYAIAKSGAGSPGKETTTFGTLTKAAVIKFQDDHAKEILVPNGLKKGTGIVASSTILYIQGIE